MSTHAEEPNRDDGGKTEWKQAHTASHLAALPDVGKHGLLKNGDKTSGGETLHNLTLIGVKATTQGNAAARDMTGSRGPAPGLERHRDRIRQRQPMFTLVVSPADLEAVYL